MVEYNLLDRRRREKNIGGKGSWIISYILTDGTFYLGWKSKVVFSYTVLVLTLRKTRGERLDMIAVFNGGLPCAENNKNNDVQFELFTQKEREVRRMKFKRAERIFLCNLITGNQKERKKRNIGLTRVVLIPFFVSIREIEV